MGLNDEVNEEFGLPTDDAPLSDREDTTVDLYTVDEDIETTNNVEDEDIFTRGIEARRLPELDAKFVIQKSKEDRLVEFVDKAADIEASGGISKNDVLAIESIMEERPLEGSQEPQKEPQDSDEDDGSELPNEPVERVLEDPRLYTEEKSVTEFEPAIQLMKSSFEKNYLDLKHSVTELNSELLKLASQELSDKRAIYVELTNQFNTNIIKFLKNYDSCDLTEVKCVFKRSVKWADLMFISLYQLIPASYEPDEAERLRLLAAYEGTIAGKFLDKLAKKLQSTATRNTVRLFLEQRSNEILLVDSNEYIIDTETGKVTNAANVTRAVVSNYDTNYTVGKLFSTIGSNRFSDFINERLKVYDHYHTELKKVPAKLADLEESNTNNIREKLNSLLEISSTVNESRSYMMSAIANIGAVLSLYKAVNMFLVRMSE